MELYVKMLFTVFFTSLPYNLTLLIIYTSFCST